MVQQTMYEDLEPIAQLKLVAEVHAAIEETQAKLRELTARFPANAGRSGQFEAAKLKIRIEGGARQCKAICEIWRELIQKRNNGRISREDKAFIMSKVEEQARYRARDAATIHPGGAGVALPAHFMREQADMGIQQAVGEINRELEIMVREQEAFPNVQRPDEAGEDRVIQVNIHNSNIANLNLGSQVGTINTALQVISGQKSSEELAQAIKDFTEAVLGSTALPDPEKQEAVQILAEIAKQAEAKPEERASGMLKAGIAYLPTLIATAAHLTGLWDKLAPLIKHYFGLV